MREKIKIKDELEIARLYLEMEQLCRKDKLSWEINTEDGIENYLICKFTLQPFFSNLMKENGKKSMQGGIKKMLLIYFRKIL